MSGDVDVVDDNDGSIGKKARFRLQGKIEVRIP